MNGPPIPVVFRARRPASARRARPRVGSLASGYGGLDLAVCHALGAVVAWHAENDPAPAKVLEHHWRPGTPNLGDLTTIDFSLIGRHAMAWPRCDERAQQMYDRYCQGLSLAQVGAEFDVTRQTVYQMFRRRGWSLRSRPEARATVVWNGRTYSLRNNGYYGATSGGRELLHRDVWRHHRGAIPDGYDIHHRDHDKTNNTISNLECLPKSEHASLYNLGCNGVQHRCGAEVVPSDSPVVDVLTAGYP